MRLLEPHELVLDLDMNDTFDQRFEQVRSNSQVCGAVMLVEIGGSFVHDPVRWREQRTLGPGHSHGRWPVGTYGPEGALRRFGFGTVGCLHGRIVADRVTAGQVRQGALLFFGLGGGRAAAVRLMKAWSHSRSSSRSAGTA